MRRIDTATKAVDMFGAGKHGFKDGDPALAILATKLNAAFFNSIQEELSRAIEGAGLTLAPADNTQLLAAITALARGVLPKRSFAANDYIRIPDVPGGLIIQHGTTSHAADGISWTYPIAFPNAALSVFANMKTDNGCATVQVLGVAAASGSSMLSGVNTTGTHSYNWLAIGY